MINKLRDLYRDLNNPVDFFNWMKDNIEYGYIDATNNKKILNDNSIDGWRLSSPDLIFRQKLGNCHDQSWFEHDFFKNKNIEHKIFYLEGWYHERECTTHTFVLFKSNLTWYHFEHSWYSYRGIHMGSKNIEYSLQQIINKWSSEENITVNKIIIRELLEAPTYGADMFEYMDYAYRFPIINLNKGEVK